MSIWQNIDLLNDNYKELISKYFKDKPGKFKIENNTLLVDFDSWGLERFYIKDINLEINNYFYNIINDNFKKIYNIGITIQIGNWNVFKKMESYIKNFKNINVNFYFVLIEQMTTKKIIDYLKYTYEDSVILTGENKGMDIGLFLISMHYIRKKKYHHDYIIKLHTKTNDNFRNQTLNILIPSHDQIINNIKLLSNDKNGMFSGNAIYRYKDDKNPFHANYYHLRNLIRYLYNEDLNYDNLEFCAGTMFMFKLHFFNILNLENIEYLYNNLNDIDTLDYHWYSVFYKMNIDNKEAIYKDFTNSKGAKYPNNISLSIKTNKPGLRDSMVEHAMERLFGYICKKNGLNII